jgi:cytoplasmic tRNA 2-thiolation protein 2
MQDRTEDIRSVVERYPSFDFVPLRIEDAFDGSWWTKVSGSSSTPQVWLELSKEGLITDGLHVASEVTDLTPVEALRLYLSSLPTQTAISSALQNLTRVLILHTAHSRGSSHLLFGSSLTSLSISLLSSISQGGGYAIHEELQEEWAPVAASGSKSSNLLRVIRPLRDVTAKECAVYVWWNNISVIGRDKQRRAILGIAALTKNFVVGLEKDYPSTVSTIARTCEKLEPKDAPSGQCRLCKRPMQSAIQEWKSRISIRSYSDDKLAADLAHIPPPCRDNLDTSTSFQVPPPLALTDFLCYSCHTTLTSRSSRGVKQSVPGVSSATPLPRWVALHEDGLKSDGARHKIPEEEMFDTVAKFLIDN